MKFLVAFAFVLVATTAVSAFPDGRRSKSKSWGKECAESTGVETTKMIALIRGEFIEDAALKNFLACVLQKSSILNADGTFNKAIAESDLGGSPTIRPAFAHCLDVTGPSVAERAWLFYKCFRTSVPATKDKSLW